MIDIHPAETKDEAPLLELVRLFPTPTPPGDVAYANAFRTKLSDPASFLAVAEEDGKLIGYISGYCHTTFYAGGKTAWVDEILVISDRRGHGVGRALMAAFEAWAELNSCSLVSLATAGASGFYEQLGYGTKAGYYKKYLVRRSG
jgi:GNAT superfamily N-acetyltransferase